MNSKEINQTKSLNFAQLLNNIPSAILLIDKEYNISFINYSAEVLLGESSRARCKLSSASTKRPRFAYSNPRW